MSTFKLPDLGEGLQDAEIVSWHVSPGDHVVADQPLVSVETAKAVVEIPSPQSGHIARLLGEPGDVIEIDADLVEFSDEAPSDPGAIVGDLSTNSARQKIAPATRHLAGELGVDISAVQGTGAGGSITRKDVELAAQPDLENIRIERVLGVRRAMAQTMAKAGSEIVPATIMDEADIDQWAGSADVTIRLARAIVAGVKCEPGLNAWYYPDKNERWIHQEIHLGLAIDTPEGLFAPVLRNIATRNDEELRNELRKLRGDVEARTIPPEDLRGQTISLSNFGMIAGQHASLVVVPPQVAILGAGRILERVVPCGGKPVMHRVLPLSLTFDHRIITGGEAARFLREILSSLEAKEI